MSSKNPVVSKNWCSNYPNWTVHVNCTKISKLWLFKKLLTVTYTNLIDVRMSKNTNMSIYYHIYS